jgi:hypothetical protein
METNFGSQATQVDGWSKQMQADWKSSKTTDLKVNPEEI